MVKINDKEVEWEKAPNFVNNIQRMILWKDEKTGASFAILRAPKGVYIKQEPHCHPMSNQFTFNLSGVIELPDGTRVNYSQDDYRFDFCPKDKMHGANSEDTKVLEDYVYLHYWDGPDDWKK